VSNLNNEVEYRSFGQALDFVFTQQFKKLHTCLPGIIQSYNQSTKRAQVLPAIERTFTNGDINFIFSARNHKLQKGI
jgi:hypothetical protein